MRKAFLGANGLWYAADVMEDGSHRAPDNGIHESAREALAAAEAADQANEDWEAGKNRMECYDRLSGEKFQAENETEIREYLAQALTEGETVAYDVYTNTGRFFRGEVTG